MDGDATRERAKQFLGCLELSHDAWHHRKDCIRAARGPRGGPYDHEEAEATRARFEREDEDDAKKVAEFVATAVQEAHALGLQGRGLDGKLLPIVPFTQPDLPGRLRTVAHESEIGDMGRAAGKQLRELALDTPAPPAADTDVFLDDRCSLSNKYCPRHYTGRKQCCPDGLCWYDEQKKRRSNGLKAYTPEAWNLLNPMTAPPAADEPAITNEADIRGKSPQSFRTAAIDKSDPETGGGGV